jgi:hypothetical protein
MITEDYVSFETAKLLKEKGFDENTPVNYFVGDDKPRGCVVGEMIYHKRLEEDTHLIACPTLQMAMKWLREEHNLFIDTYYDCDFGEGYKFSVHKLPKGTTLESHNESYSTYEKACDGAIKYCLEKLI